MKENVHVQAVPREVLAEARGKIQEVLTLLAPYMMALTPAERQGMPKMGEKTLGFVEKAYEFAQQNPKLMPPYLDMKAFDVDFADAHGFWKLYSLTLQLEEEVGDTGMVAGSEAYQAALVFYKSVKMAAAQDVPGAKAIYEELKVRFPRVRRKNGELETVKSENGMIIVEVP